MDRMRTKAKTRRSREHQELYGLEDATTPTAAAVITDCNTPDAKEPPALLSLLNQMGEVCEIFFRNYGGGGWRGASSAGMVKCGV